MEGCVLENDPNSNLLFQNKLRDIKERLQYVKEHDSESENLGKELTDFRQEC